MNIFYGKQSYKHVTKTDLIKISEIMINYLPCVQITEYELYNDPK